MREGSRKNKIDRYIENLNEYYYECSNEYFKLSNTVSELNFEEIKYLNSKLNLENLIGVEKPMLINKLLNDKSKCNFSKHILTSLNIELVVNSVDVNNKTTFQLLIDNIKDSNQYYYQDQLLALYKREYKNNKNDEIFLIDFYKNRILNERHLEIWCFARICCKLNDQAKIEKAFMKDRVIFSLLSFKQGKPIGFNFPNLLSVANNAIQHYREQGQLLIDAMKYYNVYNDIKSSDKKGSFKSKELEFLRFMPIQDLVFNQIVFEIFPELEQETRNLPNSKDI